MTMKTSTPSPLACRSPAHSPLLRCALAGASALLLSLIVPVSAHGQVTEPTGQKTLAATMSVHVFPGEGQTETQQSKDEAECYSWAVKNTGVDPFELSKQAQQQTIQAEQQKQQVAQTGKGAGAKGALGGAAVGALIGEIASDDAGKGAAWGAAAGAIGGRHRRRGAQAQATQQIDQQTQATRQFTQEQTDGFKKSFSVCLEAKDYVVRF